MDVVHKIEEVECKAADEGEEEGEQANSTEVSTPVEKVVIKTLSVDTFGVDYGMPTIMEPWNYTEWLYGLYGIPYQGEE